MAVTICVANPKGGTAKTSTAVNLCCALAATRRKVLLCDLDPQCSATVSLSFKHADEDISLAGVLIAGNDPRECVEHYELGKFDLMPANEDLTAVPVALYNEPDGHKYLKNALDVLRGNYDFIVIDTPATLNLLTVNAICASDKLIIPVTPEYFSLDAMSSLIKLCQTLKDDGKTGIELLGVLRTLYDEQSRLAKLVSYELKKQFGSLLFNTVIAFNSRISEAGASGRPIIFYDKSSTASRSSLIFAGEVLQKLSRRPA